MGVGRRGKGGRLKICDLAEVFTYDEIHNNGVDQKRYEVLCESCENGWLAADARLGRKKAHQKTEGGERVVEDGEKKRCRNRDGVNMFTPHHHPSLQIPRRVPRAGKDCKKNREYACCHPHECRQRKEISYNNKRDGQKDLKGNNICRDDTGDPIIAFLFHAWNLGQI